MVISEKSQPGHTSTSKVLQIGLGKYDLSENKTLIEHDPHTFDKLEVKNYVKYQVCDQVTTRLCLHQIKLCLSMPCII